MVAPTDLTDLLEWLSAGDRMFSIGFVPGEHNLLITVRDIADENKTATRRVNCEQLNSFRGDLLCLSIAGLLDYWATIHNSPAPAPTEPQTDE